MMIIVSDLVKRLLRNDGASIRVQRLFDQLSLHSQVSFKIPEQSQTHVVSGFSNTVVLQTVYSHR